MRVLIIFYPCCKKDLWKKLEDVMFQEKLLWFRKFKCKWLKYGGKNSCYFDYTTIIRRQKNVISHLMDEDGNWVADSTLMEGMVTDFFKNLFTQHDILETFCLKGRFPPLEDNEIDILSKEISDEEMRRFVFLMGSYKAPRENGF